MACVAVASLAVWWSRRPDDPTRAAIRSDSVVMLGDSLTEFGDWERRFPNLPIVNRGYAGYTSEQLVPVAEQVAAAGPAVVVVLAGTNDIRDGRPVSWSVDHLEELLGSLRAGRSDARIIVQTLLPRADAPDHVARLNDELAVLARDLGLELFDLHAHLDDGSGGLRPMDTTDGVHLTETGYRRWASALETVVGTARPA